ncbi:MAG: T9SS type A sorting domain-containing protein [Saprospiraceae bacterium]|nr:T9SS type A sorting domain-containing protein [Saprospiraceae bacterium]
MTKHYFISVLVLICFAKIHSQCGPISIVLSNQAQVDSFSINFPQCHRIDGNITISGNDIENLDGLLLIDSIDRRLEISNCPNLYNLYGLRNLTVVQDLHISQCPLIEDLVPFQKLQLASNSLYLYKLNIKNLKGLEKVYFIRQLHINDLDQLEELVGLDSLKTASTVRIADCGELKSLKGLRKDIEISQLELVQNNKLEALTELDLNTLYLLSIKENPNFNDLKGLSELTTLWFLVLTKNELLKNLSGLDRLKNVNINFRLEQNPLLDDISALKNISSMTLDSVIIVNNKNLEKCHIESVCNFLYIPQSIARIENNGNDCIDRLTVEKNCLKTSTFKPFGQIINVFPNPANESFIISNLPQFSKIEIYNVLGQLMISDFSSTSNQMVNCSGLKSGLYLIKINNKETFKIFLK